MADDIVHLEKGLCFFYENQKEFERKCTSIDKQVALGWAAGFEFGQKDRVRRVFKPSDDMEWP